MKKLLKRLLNNKGMTLTELIIVMFVSSVIFSIAMGLIIPVKNLMNTTRSNAHMDTISSTVNEYFRGTVQSATSLVFVRLKADNNIEDSKLVTVTEYFNKQKGKGIKAIAVLNTSADPDKDPPVYRIFDFGSVSDFSQLNDMIVAQDEDTYGLFRDPFYGDTGEYKYSCAVEFYNNSSGEKWLQVASQCKKVSKGNIDFVNQKHVLNFKLLNSFLSDIEDEDGNKTEIVEGDGVETDAGSYTPDSTGDDASIEGHGYIILYTPMEIKT